MEQVYTKSIRNVALLGHSGGGKTSLAESMLYIARLTDRLGNVADGNTTCDYHPEEIKTGYSISSAMALMPSLVNSPFNRDLSKCHFLALRIVCT